ncbi:MAG: gfo/Idh/MocA family oxidoreductase [Planctomycetes bacterium]|nr:gfo/Idh/MocA family oxidoreductase [Planctomycetota bacterium]
MQSVAVMGLSAPLLTPRLVRALSPNSKIRHASIGLSGMGKADRTSIASHPSVSMAAICDVDTNTLSAVAREYPDAKTFADWRELFPAMGDTIDSVNVTVPDHMHAIIAMTSIRAGKHTWCQKPMCHDVSEIRALTLAAAKAGVVTQLGTQHASGMGDRMAVQFMRDKVLGKANRLILCSNRPSAISYRLAGPRPAKGEAPPANLNWEHWIGTAPMRAFSPTIYHPMRWRAWQDFGTGWSGDIGCHIFNAPWKGLNMTAPKSVIAQVQESWKKDPARRADNWPQSNHITWIFPGNEFTGGEDLTVEWFDGEFYPPEEVQKLNPSEHYPPESFMMLAENGQLLMPHQSGPQLLPAEKYKTFPRPKLQPQHHWHNFIDAALGKIPAPESPFSIAGPMSETVILGTVAIRMPDTRLEWDSQSMRFTNNDDANKLLKRTYREGWTLEGL